MGSQEEDRLLLENGFLEVQSLTTVLFIQLLEYLELQSAMIAVVVTLLESVGIFHFTGLGLFVSKRGLKHYVYKVQLTRARLI